MALPCFSKVGQRTDSGDAVLLKMSWGTFEFGITLSRRPLVNNFEDALYPQQGVRRLVAISFMLLLHILLAYFLLHKNTEQGMSEEQHRERIVYLDLSHDRENQANIAQPQQLVDTKPKQQRKSTRQPTSKSRSPKLALNEAPQPIKSRPDSISSQIALARERRDKAEAQAAQQNQEAKVASTILSENELALARIKANIQSTQYKRKGVNGIFQVLDKGVRTGRFSFRGWTSNPNQSTWQTYEVDAGIGGDVELALVRRMIELIRAHYSGDFNWESQRLGRTVVLSARPSDNAQLERFLMKEFFGAS